MRRAQTTPVFALCLCSLLACTGCEAIARKQRDQQLQRAATEWNKTIRASQVIPVYPLTEDLQPGDLFLVTTTVKDQHKLWAGNDFLPLDNHLGRVNPSGYDAFYRASFFHPDHAAVLPRDWLRPPTGITPQPAKDQENGLAWQKAPMAFFPSYSFSTSVGAGASVAFPVSGVPVGLSLLGTGKATVTVQIKDARTIGVDMLSLYRDVSVFWQAQSPAALGKVARPAACTPPRYLRVISRVYLAREIQVGITDSGVQSENLSVGAPKPVNLLLPANPKKPAPGNPGASRPPAVDPAQASAQAVRTYSQNISELNRMINGLVPADGSIDQVLPGGSLQIVAASAGSISLNETFARPVAIGYLGFDMVIGPDGRLGPPIPTLTVLDQERAPTRAAEPVPTDAQILSTALDLLFEDQGRMDTAVAALTKPYRKLSRAEKDHFGRVIGTGPLADDPDRDRELYQRLRQYFFGE
ncbi:MAG: hypothetical protein AAGI68_03635 [Planctomycetota bacterium]